MSDEVEDYLRWILGIEGAREPQPSDMDLGMLVRVGISAFAIALERKFEDGATADEVRQFVAQARGTWLKPEGLNPVLAERVILSALGDENLIDDVPLADVSRTQNLLTYAMVNDLGITEEALEEFIREVIAFYDEPDDED